ncbi:hypothetical protein HYX08_04870 [Candidatus Woesearchaeota archaeon]|nr:hypothetical protein [Candidatus Woesearchaeota archaeon]
MIIHGKNVDFVIEKGDPSGIVGSDPLNLRKNPKRVLSQLKRTKIKIPYLQECIGGYLNNDVGSFLDYCIKMVTQVFIEELKENPSFITSNNFIVNINLIFQNSTHLGKYFDKLSGLEKALFRVNPIGIIREIVFYGRFNLSEIIYHEFIHHLRNCYGKNAYQWIDKAIDQLAQQEQRDPSKITYLINAQCIIFVLDSVSNEGIAEFAAQYQKRKRIPFEKHIFAEIIFILDLLCTDFGPEVTNKATKILEQSRAAYKIGSLIVATIVLHKLFSNNKKFYAWLKIYGVWFGRRTYNAIEIGKFYNTKLFDLYFTYDDEETDRIVEQTIADIYGMSHLGFLKAYEEACVNLKIKPFFTLQIYDFYKRECWQNYQALKREGRI